MVVVIKKLRFFKNIFLSLDISLNTPYRLFKFSACTHEIQMHGRVSENLDSSPSRDFMKCRKLKKNN